MPVNTYCLINDVSNICVNRVIWNPDEAWNPPIGHTPRIIADCNIGDEVENVNGIWQVKQ